MTADEEQIRLARLAGIPRNASKSAAVAIVMATDANPREKIRRIEAIDRSEESEAAGGPATRPRGALFRPPKPAPPEVAEPVPEPVPPPVPPAPVTPEPPPIPPEQMQARQVAESCQRLGRLPPRGHWWTFLFKEISAIVACTPHLKRDWWPFRLCLTSEAAEFLARDLVGTVLPPLDRTLSWMIAESWKVLPKTDYNLLCGAANLVAATRRVTVIGKNWRDLWMAWSPLLPLVLRFHAGGGWEEALIAAWNRATGSLGVDPSASRTGEASLRALVSEQVPQPALVSVLLSLAMADRRKVLTLADLVPDVEGMYWPTLVFEAPANVRPQIEAAIEKLATQADFLRQRMLEVRRLRYFVPEEDVLTPFLGSPEVETEAEWAVAFLDRFLGCGTPLFQSSVTMATGETVVLIRNETLASLAENLHELRGRLWDPSSVNADSLIEAAAHDLMSIAKALAVMIRNRSCTADPAIRLDDINQITDPLPFEESPLARPDFWAGRTVLEALVSTTQVCFAAARRLGDTSVEGSLDRENQLEARARDNQRQIERLATPTEAERLASQWNGFELEKSAD